LTFDVTLFSDELKHVSQQTVGRHETFSEIFAKRMLWTFFGNCWATAGGILSFRVRSGLRRRLAADFVIRGGLPQRDGAVAVAGGQRPSSEKATPVVTPSSAASAILTLLMASCHNSTAPSLESCSADFSLRNGEWLAST
jgi:hypothetical protein